VLNFSFFTNKFRHPLVEDVIEREILISYEEDFLVDLFQRSIVVLGESAEDGGMLFRVMGPRGVVERLKELAG